MDERTLFSAVIAAIARNPAANRGSPMAKLRDDTSSAVRARVAGGVVLELQMNLLDRNMLSDDARDAGPADVPPDHEALL